MPAKKKPPGPDPRAPINPYACPIPGKDQLFYDMWAFGRRTSIDAGAPTRIDLFRRITNILVPGWFEWHRWTERLVGAACENKWLGMAGCAGSAKSRNVAGFAAAWWLCCPLQSSVILCSTTVKAMRQRCWAEIANFYTSIPGPRIGNMVDSQIKWQAEKGDDKHAIIGIAVEGGDVVKAADNIKGVHTRRQLVIIDEATTVPPAIHDAITNLYGTPEEFILIMAGNPRSRLDAFGKFCEPVNGWDSLNIDVEEWETTPKLDGKTGVCIRFDAEKSPNIMEGRIVSRWLPTKERVEQRRNKAGSADDPTYWSNERGFWPPDGMTKTVFSEAAIQSSGGYGKHDFTGKNFQVIGALDPARTGGDRPALRFGVMGEIKGGGIGIEWLLPKVIPLDATSTNPIDYQLTEQVRRECESVKYRGLVLACPPENLGVDATGGGADLCDIINRTWSAKVMRIGFGETASDDSCSPEDIRPASAVYRNKRAEMYFRSRTALNLLQLKGIDQETAQELCKVMFNDDKKLITLISKKTFKQQYGYSPDLADSGIMLIEVARRKGFTFVARGETKVGVEDAKESHEAAVSVYQDIDYSPEEEAMDFA